VATTLLWLAIPLLTLYFIGLLGRLIAILESIALDVGNIHVSLYGLIRVVLFGSLLFWLGRISNNTGQDIIRRQQQLELRTREVAAKLLQVSVVAVVFLLLLQVMGVNLTALAVFGGAVGVGLGFGLQAIASNFISGIIILLDRSVSVDDYIQSSRTSARQGRRRRAALPVKARDTPDCQVEESALQEPACIFLRETTAATSAKNSDGDLSMAQSRRSPSIPLPSNRP
jgi:hypothetical protein